MKYTSILNAVSNVSGSSFVGINTLTTPKLIGGKSNPHQGRVQKRMIGASVMVFQNKNSNGYENMIKRRLRNEGKNPETFKLGERKWGTRVENMPIVKHIKDGSEKNYLEVIFLKSGKIEYTLDGKLVDASEIQGSESREEGEQGGLDDKVVIRTFDFDSITEMHIDGSVYF
jgi:hypothetical protein